MAIKIKTRLDTYDFHRMAYSLRPDTADRIILSNRHTEERVYITREFDDEERPYFVLEFTAYPGMSITFDSLVREPSRNCLGLNVDRKFMGRLSLDCFKLIDCSTDEIDATQEDSE